MKQTKCRKHWGYWTVERIAEEAKKYKTRGEFRSKDNQVYSYACSIGVLSKVCAHMPSGRAREVKNFKSFFDISGSIARMLKGPRDYTEWYKSDSKNRSTVAALCLVGLSAKEIFVKNR